MKPGMRTSWISVVMLMIGASGAVAQVVQAGPSHVKPVHKPAALVNGEPIGIEEVEAVLLHEPPTANPPTEIQRRQMQLEALSLLIDDRLVQQFLRKNGPPVSSAEVNKKLAELESGLKAQGRTLTDFLKENALTADQLKADTVKMLQWAGFVRQQIKEAELRRYYEENKDYFDQIKVRASHIVFRIPGNAPPAEIETSRARLEKLRQEIASGKIDFAEAARKYSQCPSSRDGGNIGYFFRKYTVQEPIARAAFGLKVGEISDVVQSDYGLHLIRVTDRKANGPPSDFEKIKEQVREACAMEMMNNLVAQERKVAKIEINLAGEAGPIQPVSHQRLEVEDHR
jgi:parvulin-like peptidyl-prolyl isomerase